MFVTVQMRLRKQEVDKKLPGIVVTGASGFVGRNLIESVAGKFRLFCIARRAPEEVGIQRHENIRWTQLDIENWRGLQDVAQYIKNHGGADYVLHLAGYYDFSGRDNPEYERTNVTGTRNILKLAELIGVKRFIFASSLAACDFASVDKVVNEQSSADARFPYALSKRRGEDMMKEYSEKFPCTVIRLAAVYSDWCEYPPLYVFLDTWLSRKRTARILGGYGESSVTYIHINDLVRLFLRIIDLDKSLPRLCTYIASPSGTTSHGDLFRTATRYYYGHDVEPILMPKSMATLGVAARHVLGRITGREPFERLWMMKYIDKKLRVDASYTHRTLGWEPIPRYHVLRRLLFLVEKMKHYRDEWSVRNEALLRRIAQRPSTMIYHVMVKYREEIVDKVVTYIRTPKRHKRFARYQHANLDSLKWYTMLFYMVIAGTVRSRSHLFLRDYMEIISARRFAEGFTAREVTDFVLVTGNIMNSVLLSKPELEGMEERVYDHILLPIQLAADEVEDSYALLQAKSPEVRAEVVEMRPPGDSEDLKRIVRQLEDICTDAPSIGLDIADLSGGSPEKPSPE